MKNRGIIMFLIIILTVISISLLFLLGNLLSGKSHFNFFRGFSKESKELILEETYQGDIPSIIFETDASNIVITSTPSNEMHLKIYGEKEKTNVKASEESLQIETKSENHIISFGQTLVSKIELAIPKDYQGEIKIENDYGDVEIASFSLARISIRENCGDIEIASAKEVVIKNDYGDTDIEQAEIVNINASCGDIKLGNIGSVKVKTSYGNVKVKEVTNSLDINSSCGDVKIEEVDLKENSKIRSSLGSIKIEKTNDIYINASTSLGDIKIERNNPKAEITLDIKNDCGDVKVD